MIVREENENGSGEMIGKSCGKAKEWGKGRKILAVGKGNPQNTKMEHVEGGRPFYTNLYCYFIHFLIRSFKFRMNFKITQT